MGWYMHKSYKRNGISKSDVYNQYLAYHEGHSGFRRGTYKRKKWLIKLLNQYKKELSDIALSWRAALSFYFYWLLIY
jgi:hypothetical protein